MSDGAECCRNNAGSKAGRNSCVGQRFRLSVGQGRSHHKGDLGAETFVQSRLRRSQGESVRAEGTANAKRMSLGQVRCVPKRAKRPAWQLQSERARASMGR